MARIRAASSAIIDAPPEQVYAIITDYRTGHPRILPKEHFRDLQVEQGGVGAGTIITFALRSGGSERRYRMAVSEPEPGRVLMESDTASTLTTTFTVTPANEGKQARVEIATEWDASKGIGGIIEKLLYPAGMKRIYDKELRQLAEVVRSINPSERRQA